MADANIELRRLNKETTMFVDVKVTREFRWRMALALFLIKLGVRCTGASVKVRESDG